MGKHDLIIPSAVLIEVAAVISAMSDKKLAGEDIYNIQGNAVIVYDDPNFTEQAIAYALELRLSGFDATVATCAVTNTATLITNDGKFFRAFSDRAKDFGVRVLLFRDMTEEQIKELV